MTVFSFYFEL